MKLQKIIELTNLSRKAIYFYIKEGLINPAKNFENGYYDFSEEDLKKLQVIISLRKIGMPIQDIKELFIYPTLSNFFIHKQINKLKSELYENIKQLEASYKLIEDIPANATPESIQGAADSLKKEKIFNEIEIDNYFPSKDSRMIAILLCAPFMDIEASEYHNFLWDKISKELKIQSENNLSCLKKMIYKLTPEQILSTSEAQYEFSKRITDMKEDELPIYEAELYERCVEMAGDKELQEYWNLIYEPILKPSLQFFNNKVRRLLGEFNPKYKRYNDNMICIAENVYKKLNENEECYEKIRRALKYKFNPELNNYRELICIYTFKESIFTKLKIEDLEEVIK